MIRALRNVLRAARVLLVEQAKLTREHRRSLKRYRKNPPPAPQLAASTAPPPPATATRRREPGSDSETPYDSILSRGEEIAAEYDKLEQEMRLDVAAQQRRNQHSLTGEAAQPEPIPAPPPPPPAKEYTVAAVPPSSTVRSGAHRLAAAVAGAPAAELSPDAPALPAADIAAQLDELEQANKADLASLAARQAQEAAADAAAADAAAADAAGSLPSLL